MKSSVLYQEKAPPVEDKARHLPLPMENRQWDDGEGACIFLRNGSRNTLQVFLLLPLATAERVSCGTEVRSIISCTADYGAVDPRGFPRRLQGYLSTPLASSYV